MSDTEVCFLTAVEMARRIRNKELSAREAVAAGRFWVIPHQEFLDIAADRWETILERADPEPPEHIPGMPPRSQIIAEVVAALGVEPSTSGP